MCLLLHTKIIKSNSQFNSVKFWRFSSAVNKRTPPPPSTLLVVHSHFKVPLEYVLIYQMTRECFAAAEQPVCATAPAWSTLALYTATALHSGTLGKSCHRPSSTSNWDSFPRVRMHPKTTLGCKARTWHKIMCSEHTTSKLHSNFFAIFSFTR